MLLELSSLTKADDALYSFPHNIRNNEKIPDGIKAIIEQCLSLDPASRPTFQSINSTLRSPLQQTANNGPILTVLSITQSTLADRNISRQSSTVVIFNSVVTGEKQRQITTSPNTSVKDLKEISPQSIPNTTSPTGSNMQQQHQSMKKAPSNLKKAHSGSQGEVGSNNDVKSNPSTASRTNMSPLVPDMMAGLSPISGKMPEKSTGSSARALLHITHKRNGDGSGGGGGGVNASTSLGGSGAGQLDSFVSIQNSLIVEPIPKMERLKPASKERERDKDRDRYMGRSGADSSFAGASRGGGVPSINYSIHSAANSNFESKSIIDSEAEPQMLRMYGINSTTGQPDNKKRKLRAGAGNNNRGVAALRRSKKRPFRMNMAIVTCLVLAVAIIIIAVLVKFAKGSSSSSTSSNVADGAVSTLSTSSSVYTLSISTTLTAFTPTTSAIQTQT